MKNNSNYTLYCLINVFKLTPVFLLPVFKDENDILYFQKINSENINEVQFVKVANVGFEEFKNNSTIIYLNSPDYIFLGNDIKTKNITEPIRAVQLEEFTIFISNTKGMVDYFSNNNFSDTKFYAEIKRFIKKYNT